MIPDWFAYRTSVALLEHKSQSLPYLDRGDGGRKEEGR